jgi:nitroreductase
VDLFEAIAKRHTYRGAFKPDLIPREHLGRIVDAGIRAPSGTNAQSTSFVIIDDPALLRQVAAIVPKTFVAEAPAVILCVADRGKTYHGHSFAAEDCAAAVENMLLAITALGYATVWLDGFLRLEGRARRLAELLKVPAPFEPRVLLPIGIPAEERPQRERLPFDERAAFNSWCGRKAIVPSN